MAGIFYPPAPRDRLVKPSFQQTQEYGLDWDNPLVGGNQLKAFWPINEGSGQQLYDLVNRIMLSPTGGSPYVWTGSSRGVTITTTDDTANRVLSTTDSCLIGIPATFNFSVSAWCYAPSYLTADSAWTFYGTDDLIFYPFDTDTGNGVRLYWRDAGGSIINQNTGSVNNEWTCFTFCCYASNSHKLYINASTNLTSSANASAAGPFTGFSLYGWAEGPQNFINGMLDAVMIHSPALSEQQVYQYYVNPYQVIYTPRWSHFVDLGGSTPSGFMPSWAWRKTYVIGGGVI